MLKAAHSFNLLDARGAISVTERAAYIGRIRHVGEAKQQAALLRRVEIPARQGLNAEACGAGAVGQQGIIFVRFCPAGGVSTANAAEFLSLPNVVCVGGS